MCEQELVRDTERFSGIMAQCYRDSGVGLEYTILEVEAAFKKHRLSGAP